MIAVRVHLVDPAKTAPASRFGGEPALADPQATGMPARSPTMSWGRRTAFPSHISLQTMASMTTALSPAWRAWPTVTSLAEIPLGSPHLREWWARLEQHLPELARRANGVRVIPRSFEHVCTCEYCTATDEIMAELDEFNPEGGAPFERDLFRNLDAHDSVRTFVGALVAGLWPQYDASAQEELARAVLWVVDLGDHGFGLALVRSLRG